MGMEGRILLGIAVLVGAWLLAFRGTGDLDGMPNALRYRFMFLCYYVFAFIWWLRWLGVLER